MAVRLIHLILLLKKTTLERFDERFLDLTIILNLKLKKINKDVLKAYNAFIF